MLKNLQPFEFGVLLTYNNYTIICFFSYKCYKKLKEKNKILWIWGRFFKIIPFIPKIVKIENYKEVLLWSPYNNTYRSIFKKKFKEMGAEQFISEKIYYIGEESLEKTNFEIIDNCHYFWDHEHASIIFQKKNSILALHMLLIYMETGSYQTYIFHSDTLICISKFNRWEILNYILKHGAIINEFVIKDKSETFYPIKIKKYNKSSWELDG